MAYPTDVRQSDDIRLYLRSADVPDLTRRRAKGSWTDERTKWRPTLIAISSCGCFLLGMLCLSVFVTWNFWRTA